MPQRSAQSKVSAVTVEVQPARASAAPGNAAAQKTPMDSILDKVVDHVDIEGLSGQIADKLAHRLGSTVSIDGLADAILDQHTEELSRRLSERITERLTCSMLSAGASKAAGTCSGAVAKETS